MGSMLSRFALTRPGAVRLYSMQELLRLPPPTWLVDGMIPNQSLVGLYGAPESTKSFAAIDLALCIATGTPWHGHDVQPGLALYVAAEGGIGISKRGRAWLQYHAIHPTKANIAWLLESIEVYSGSDDLDKLMSRLDDELEVEPQIIILDTLARCLDGDENQQEDMGRFIAGMDKLRHAYGSTVMAVHHTRLDGDRERGSTSFRGGLDTVMMMSRRKDKPNAPIVLSCEKQKDAEHFDRLKFRLLPVGDTDSCVLADYEVPVVAIPTKFDQMLNVLKKGPLPWDEWLVQSQVKKTSFYRRQVELLKNGQIVKENGLWRLNTP